jgi:hypothetical protein
MGAPSLRARIQRNAAYRACGAAGGFDFPPPHPSWFVFPEPSAMTAWTAKDRIIEER